MRYCWGGRMLWSVWIGALAVLSPSSWEAPEDCGSRTAFDERVEALLPDGADAGKMTATVQVRRDGELWRLTLRMSGPDGDETRTFEADRCLVTVEAAALVVAMRASVPDAVEVPVPPNPPPQPGVPESGPTAVVKEPIERPGETPVAAPVPGPPPVAVEPRRWGGWLDAGAGVGFGLLPNLGASVLLRAGSVGRGGAWVARSRPSHRGPRHPRPGLLGAASIWSVGGCSAASCRGGVISRCPSVASARQARFERRARAQRVEFGGARGLPREQRWGSHGGLGRDSHRSSRHRVRLRPFALVSPGALRRRRSWVASGGRCGSGCVSICENDENDEIGPQKRGRPGTQRDSVMPDSFSRPSTRRPPVSAVYRAHHGFVWQVLRGLGVSARDLEDAVQDVFVVVLRRYADFEHRAAVRTWLYEIARRVAWHYRDRARRASGRREELHEA